MIASVSPASFAAMVRPDAADPAWPPVPHQEGNDPEPACAVLREERLRQCLWGAPGRRPLLSGPAAAAAWLGAYFGVLLPAVVVPALTGFRADGSPRNCLVTLRAGAPVALAFMTPPARAGRVNVEDVYGPLLADHAERAVRTVYAATGLSPRNGWAQAGDTLDALFRRFASRPEMAQAIETHRLVVFGLSATGWFPDHNPLFRG